MFKGKKILIGVGGGIAAYRVAELARLLMKQGAGVRCVMTKSACEFVTPLTFEALTGEEVHTELFDLTGEREMGHIKLARWADVLLVAPATANLLTKFAHGVADDLLTTIFQVREGNILLAPAMNTSMWESAANQRNVKALQNRGIDIIGPEAGSLACGEEGMGRMSEPETILQALYQATTPDSLSGQRWVINAGPTHEYWDQVRFLSNAATGRLGFCLAQIAAARGAAVDLVCGPTGLATPHGVTRHDVTSAAEMLEACERHAAGANVFVATAAVSDFAFAEQVDGKLKRGDTKSMNIQLAANPDIVAHIAAMKERPAKVIAFAAECERHEEHAAKKLKAKGVDAIFTNDVANMGSDTAGGWWLSGTSGTEIEAMPKWRLAERLIDLVECLR